MTDHFHQNNLLKKFGIVIPLNSIHDFTSFCTRLSEEQPLRQEVVRQLFHYFFINLINFSKYLYIFYRSVYYSHALMINPLFQKV